MTSAYVRSLSAFLQVPREVFIILAVEFLGVVHGRLANSVSYQLLQNEYGMTEVEVTALNAIASPINLIVSTLGAPFIDLFGVRRVVLVSLALSTITHSLFAFGRSRWSLYVYLMVPSEAVVGLALFTIALKDLTTTRTRPIAFAISTNLLNMASVQAGPRAPGLEPLASDRTSLAAAVGLPSCMPKSPHVGLRLVRLACTVVVSLNLVEALRHFDVELGGVLFSGLRLSVVVAVALTILEWLLVYGFVVDAHAIELPATAHEDNEAQPMKAPAAARTQPDGEAASPLAPMPAANGRPPRLRYFDSDRDLVGGVCGAGGSSGAPSSSVRSPLGGFALAAMLAPTSRAAAVAAEEGALLPLLRTEQSARRLQTFDSAPGAATPPPPPPLPPPPRNNAAPPSEASAVADSHRPSHSLDEATPAELLAAAGAPILSRRPGYIVVAKRPPGLAPRHERAGNGSQNGTGGTGGARSFAAMRDWLALVRDARFVRLAVYDLFMTGARNQWAQMSTLMVTFLTRAFGEATPAYSIRSINPTILMVAPALLAPLTAHLDVFGAMLPALWLFCAAPLPMALAPSVPSAAAWMVFSGVGEAVWSPRSRAWMTELAPSGQEAVFLTLVGFVPYLPRLLVGIVNGWLNQTFLPNCRGCRDSVGHFCARFVAEAGTQAAGCVSSIGERCHELDALAASDAAAHACPDTCAACPSWEARPRVLFTIVLAMALSSPLLITLTLPLLRGERTWTCSCFGTRQAAKAGELI